MAKNGVARSFACTISVGRPCSSFSFMIRTSKRPQVAQLSTNNNNDSNSTSSSQSRLIPPPSLRWAERNVDPALFSRELVSNVSSFVDDEEVSYDPQALLRKAHAATVSVGSATVIVAMLERSGTLRIATVGDCGLRVIRKGQVIFLTSPQEHYFDCPYQLSSEAIGQTYLDAVVTSIELMEGDMIVMGSDGLYDNVFDQEIISTVAEHSDVAEAAKALASLAKDHSTDSNFDSPYSLEARARGFDVPVWKKILGGRVTGGKLDDITVIVARVVRCPIKHS